jgi:DNA mismatch endonuclease (patch repair protein)
MSRVGGKNTAPEMRVRQAAHALGYRFRLHRKNLPGTPDIVFPGSRKIILVNGCFWHGHECRRGALPKSRVDYWGPKISRNKERDAQNLIALKEHGWDVLTIWECETLEPQKLIEKITRFLGGARTDKASLKHSS